MNLSTGDVWLLLFVAIAVLVAYFLFEVVLTWIRYGSDAQESGRG